VLLVGLAVTTAAWYAARSHERERAVVAFDRATEHVQGSIVRRMQDYERILRGARGVMASSDSDSVTPDAWRAYVAGLKLRDNYPGVATIGFVQRVTDNNRTEHFPVEYLEPGSGQVPASDMYSEPRLRAAMEEARDGGRSTLSGKVSTSLFMFCPLYAARLPHRTVTDRRQTTRGFVYAELYVNDLLGDLLRDRPAGIEVAVYEDEGMRPESQLYGGGGGSPEDSARFSRVLKLAVTGRSWTLKIGTQPEFEASVRGAAPRLVILGGVAINLLLFAFLEIAERKRSRRELADRRKTEEENQTLAALVENSTEYVAMATLEGISLYLNPAGRALIGADREDDVIGKPIADLIHEDELQTLRESLTSVHTAGSWSGETSFRHVKTGRPIRCEMTVFLVKWPHTGQPICLACVARDISERKSAENALRESESRFRQMAAGIQEAFWLLNVDTHDFLYISPAFESIWGRPCASLYAAPSEWLEAIHPEERHRFGPASIASRTRDESYEEYRIVRPDGAVRFIRERAFPIRNEEGRVHRIAAIAEDITERRRLEAELSQSQKMEAIGTLAGGIAHDFNNILGAIIGYTELALMDATGNSVLTKNLKAIGVATQRAASLVGQILAFSRRQEPERRRIHLEDVVSEALDLLRASLPASIQIRTTFDPAAPAVLVDPTQVHQVVMNLGTNAWQAMTEGGVLEVSIGPFDVDVDTAKMRVDLSAGRYALLSFRDTGQGMDRATLDRMFEPFFTTKAQGQGTGLGLSTVHGIMKNHEGAISVYSHPGEGTTFHLYFPALNSGMVDADGGARSAPHGEGQRILFVDDEEPLAQWGRQALERLGYRVTSYTDVFEALAALSDRPTDFDVVITDLTMPSMNGTRFAELVHASHPAIPIILTTGYSAALTSQDLCQFGICELVLKPNTIQGLGEAVHGVLTTRQAA